MTRDMKTAEYTMKTLVSCGIMYNSVQLGVIGLYLQLHDTPNSY